MQEPGFKEQGSDRKSLIQQLNSDNDDKSVMSSLIPRTTEELCPKLLREECRMQDAGAKREAGFTESRILISESSQRGFSLITAIFLLVVIAALGTFAVTLSTTQHQSQTMDVMGARAYQAALAGIEFAAYKLAPSAVAPAWTKSCPASTPVSFDATSPLVSFSPVTVYCNATSALDGADTFYIYNVSAVAHTTGLAGDANYVEQTATARLCQKFNGANSQVLCY